MDDKSNQLPVFDPTFPTIGPPRTARKRARPPPDSPPDPAKVREKREKARERQRRKRERDRMRDSNGMSVMSFPPPTPGPSHGHNHGHNQESPSPSQEHLSPEEASRRDKVRAAARERQRKHRAIVKQKKMAELGLAMGNDAMGGMEEMHYALGPDGQYQPVMPQPHELGHDQPFPQGQTGGQTFASTLLLSFSCSPLLKQHLLRSLHMTNEELASLEPVLSNAWDQWDHARRVHYAEQAAKASGSDHTGATGGPSEPHPYAHAHVQQDGQSPSNDFRVRFHRPLTAPSPFRTMSSDAAAAQALAQAQAQAAVIAQQAQAQQQQQQQQQQRQRHASNSSASPSEHHNENAIDPSLSAGGANGEHGDVGEGEGDEGSGSELDAAGDDGDDGGDKE